MRKRYAVLFAAGMLGFFGATPQIFGQPIQIYSSGDFQDPSASMDRSVNFLQLSTTYAESFSLPSPATLDSVNLWTYDNFDGSGGQLRQVQYALYAGGLQPSGTPIAAGFGNITSSGGLSGHIWRGGPCDEWYTIATSFNLAAPVNLNPGTTYWLALAGAVDPSGVNAQAVWAGANAVGGSYLVQNGSGWDSFSGEHAFVLNGEIMPVPEPSTLALVGIGSCGLWMWCRRQSR